MKILITAILILITGVILGNSKINRSESFIKMENMACGIKPIPPIGCVVGNCVCDQNGSNCRWTFICN